MNDADERRDRARRYLAIIEEARGQDWTEQEAEQLAALRVFAGLGAVDAGFRVAAGESLPELVAEARRALGLDPLGPGSDAGSTGE